MATTQICITDLTAAGLRDFVAGLGEPEYRARQLLHAVYEGLVASWNEATDLPKSLREKLAKTARLCAVVPVREVTGRDGTTKALLALHDGKTVETALMPQGGRRYSVCVSTQVGCAICCPFCATGQQGFERNLTPGEVIDQVLYFARRLRQESGRAPAGTGEETSHVTNLVFMGMGEPLANYDAVWQAIEMLNSPECFGLGARHMTISTAGLVPGIRRLSREKLQVGLAVSLHAPDNALRNSLVPLNKRYPLERLVPACREYFERTGRRPSFEYVLLEGLNDSVAQARALARLLEGLNCHVNLIRASPTGNSSFKPSPTRAVVAFEKELGRLHVACTLRRGMGLDIDAGCGQLRSRPAR